LFGFKFATILDQWRNLGNMAGCLLYLQGGGLSPMSSNFTQTQRDLLNNVKQTVALVDKELQRIREQRVAVCLSGFELDWQLACIGANQSDVGSNKLGSMINAHTDFQAALKEINGPQSQGFINGSNGSDPTARRLAASTPERSVAALAEAAIEKALANGTHDDNKENPDALPPQRPSGRKSGAQVN